MKRLVLIVLACAAFSCSKNETPEPAPLPTDTTGNGNGTGSVPSTFTQKVLLETFVGSWCSTCPDADYKRDEVVNASSGRVVAVSVHQTDAMSIPLFDELYNVFGQSSPSGMVNRTPSLGNVLLSPSQWLSNATVALGKTAVCGLKLQSAYSGGMADITVHAGFNASLSGDYRLSVYLVEDSVTGTGSAYDQMNAYNNSMGSPFYQKGNPITGYHHNRVVRKVLTTGLGEVIPYTKLVAGGEYVSSFTGISLFGYDAARLYVVAYVHHYVMSTTTREVMNVQTAALGATRDWD